MTCHICSTPLNEISGEVRLDAEHPRVRCPLCGTDFQNMTIRGASFDERTRRFVLWDSYAPAKIGKFTIHVVGNAMNVGSCLYDSIVIFENGRADAYTPVKPEWKHLVKDCELEAGAGQLKCTFRVTTLDGSTHRVTLDCVRVPDPGGEQPQAALLVWPRFRLAGWSSYYTHFNTPLTGEGNGLISRVFDESGRGTPVDGAYAHLDYAPAYIEIEWERLPQRTKHFVGFIPKFSTITPIASPSVKIGVDFGTSNTAAAVRIAGRESQPKPIENPIEIDDLALAVLPGRIGPEATWLPRPQDGRVLQVLPSQLYFGNEITATSIRDDLSPVVDFTIPWFQDDDSDSLTIGGFKWSKLLKEALRTKALVLRRLYLRLALEMYLAQVVDQYKVGAGEITVIATYPLAFNDIHRQLHRDSFRAAVDELETCTPFSFFLETELNESHAGESGAGYLKSEVDEVFIVDVGGGTTDICISSPATDGTLVSCQDSIEFGGENVNKAVLPLTRSDSPGSITTSLSMSRLRRNIRRHGVSFLAKERTFLDAGAKRESAQIFQRFEEGLVELCARFLAARLEAVWSDDPEKSPRFGLLMLGNGWKVLEPPAAKMQIPLESYVGTKIWDRLSAYQSAGKISCLPAGHSIKVEYPFKPKEVVALGAALHFRVGQPPRPTRVSYMLLDMMLYVNQGKPRSLSWKSPIPCRLDHQSSDCRLASIGQFGFDFAPAGGDPEAREKMQRRNFVSDCAPDIEHNLEITTSPFAVLMKEYADRLRG